MIRFIYVTAVLCALSTAASARQYVRTPAVHPECNITMPCDGVATPAPTTNVVSRHSYQPPLRVQRDSGGAVDAVGTPGGLVAPLAAKLASIESACPGTQAISGIRHTRIAGTRRMSLHAQGKAVDVRGPYGCIYAQLKNWSGGYSTDAGRVQHVHISYDDTGGREMGLRFAHSGRRHHAWHNAYARMR